MFLLDQKQVEEAAEAMVEAATGDPDRVATKDEKEQVIAFILALNKNIEREEQYKGLWKQDDLTDIGALIGHKAKRLISAQDRMINVEGSRAFEDATDDALDAINYSAFAARLIHYEARGSK